jgi:hypothetical protein
LLLTIQFSGSQRPVYESIRERPSQPPSPPKDRSLFSREYGLAK